MLNIIIVIRFNGTSHTASRRGSIRGPLLFIIYKIDLPFCVKHCKTILFAYDTTIYKTGTQVNNIYEDMNKELQILADWFRANK